MKKLLFLSAVFFGAVPAMAESSVGVSQEVASPHDRYKNATYAEMDRKAAAFELTPTAFRLDAYTIVGKINVVPFQSYAASNVRIRSAAGVSVTFKF